MGAGLLAGLLTGTVAAQIASLGSGNVERVETGQIRTSTGAPESYRIRLLPIDSFLGVPAPVAGWLRNHGCMIPQTFEAQQPENVIHGAFRASGSEDWAALCSVGGDTTLYVFLAGQASAPVALRSQPDTLWLGHEPGSAMQGSAWGISIRTAEDLRNSPQIRPGFIIDHDAIEDADLERLLTLRYFRAGHWQVLQAEDFH